jgi:hypothetical protein
MDSLLQFTVEKDYEVRAIRPPQWDFIAEQVEGMARHIVDTYNEAIRHGMDRVTAHRCMLEALERNNAPLLAVMRDYTPTYVVTRKS